jgi:hypothetical protein
MTTASTTNHKTEFHGITVQECLRDGFAPEYYMMSSCGCEKFAGSEYPTYEAIAEFVESLN